MKTITRFADRLAIGVAAACGVHCLCMPVLLSVSALAGFVGRVSEPVEYLFLTSSFVLGVANLTHSYRRKHHRPECLCMFCAGFFMVAVRDHVPVNGIAAAVGIGGGALLGAAHFRNLNLCRRNRCCASCDRDEG